MCTSVYVHSCFSIDGFRCLLLLQSHTLSDKAAQSTLHLCCTAFLCCGALLAAAAAAKSFDCIPLKLSHSRASCELHDECLALPQLQPTTQTPSALFLSLFLSLCRSSSRCSVELQLFGVFGWFVACLALLWPGFKIWTLYNVPTRGSCSLLGLVSASCLLFPAHPAAYRKVNVEKSGLQSLWLRVIKKTTKTVQHQWHKLNYRLNMPMLLI